MAAEAGKRALRSGFDRARDAREQRRRFGGEYHFADRRRRSERLVMILAGYKQYLWPYTLDRMARFMAPGVDVCITSSGTFSDDLAELARENGWSYLATEPNRITMAQNVTIAAHPDATLITKL